MTINSIISAIEFFIKRLEAAVIAHEQAAIKYIKVAEAAELKKLHHFTEAVRARNIAAKVRDLIS